MEDAWKVPELVPSGHLKGWELRHTTSPSPAWGSPNTGLSPFLYSQQTMYLLNHLQGQPWPLMPLPFCPKSYSWDHVPIGTWLTS